MWVGCIFSLSLNFQRVCGYIYIQSRSVRHFDTTTRQQNNICQRSTKKMSTADMFKSKRISVLCEKEICKNMCCALSASHI